MTFTIPDSATAYGFHVDGLGSHSSRTMMLRDLQQLLAACPPSTDRHGYRAAVIHDNVLLKATAANRVKSWRHLRELYALDPRCLLFRTLRRLWDQQPAAQPVLALLCALARDPALRATAGLILDTSEGAPISAPRLAAPIAERFEGRLNATTLGSMGRNVASTWQQSGHLVGHLHKHRAQAQTYPVSSTYALLLGYLCEARGDGLFATPWVRLLDAPAHQLRRHAQAAARQGWLEYRHSGAVTDITFRYLQSEAGHERD